MLVPRQLLLLLCSMSHALSILPRTRNDLGINPQRPLSVDYRIPTIHESTIQARRILRLEDIGTLSTNFPSSSSSVDVSPLERRPDTVAGLPFGSMDYFADCEPTTGNPTILQLDIGTSFKNAHAGSNTTLSVRWHPPGWRRYSAVAQPRFSLVGYLEEMTADEVENGDIERCYSQYHPDAVAWLPGNAIHTSRWVRLVVTEVYWIGGFGDRAYIGWIPISMWRNITREEIDKCTLPGESSKGLFW